MPFGFTDFSTLNPAGFTAFQRGTGLVVPKNEVDGAPTVIWTQTGETTDADESDTAIPGFAADPRLFDELPHKRSKPDPVIVGASNTWFVAIDFGAAGVTIDSIVLIHQNLATLGVTVSVEIADSADFLTNPITIATQVLATPAVGQSDPRVGFFQLDHLAAAFKQYTVVRFLRVKMVRVPVFVPQLHQLIIGQRAQFLVNPLISHDPEGNVSGREVFLSRAGAGRITDLFQGRGDFSAAFTTQGTAEFAPLEDTWRRSNRGNKHVTWVPRPKTLPAESFLARISPSYRFPFRVAERVRSGSWDIVEQGPPFVELER